MTEDDKILIDLVADKAATKAVEKAIDKLNCKDHEKRISTNEQILNDGLIEDNKENQKSIRNLRWWFVFMLISIAGSFLANKIV